MFHTLPALTENETYSAEGGTDTRKTRTTSTNTREIRDAVKTQKSISPFAQGTVSIVNTVTGERRVVKTWKN